MTSIGVVFGACGWGACAGLFPAVRLGYVHVWCCRGSIFDRFLDLRCSLSEAVLKLTKSRQAMAVAQQELSRGGK